MQKLVIQVSHLEFTSAHVAIRLAVRGLLNVRFRLRVDVQGAQSEDPRSCLQVALFSVLKAVYSAHLRAFLVWLQKESRAAAPSLSNSQRCERIRHVVPLFLRNSLGLSQGTVSTPRAGILPTVPVWLFHCDLGRTVRAGPVGDLGCTGPGPSQSCQVARYARLPTV